MTTAARAASPQEPQGFRRDGSWGEHFDVGLTGFVRRLCAQRRATDDPPWVYARAVQSAGYERAFTNCEAWLGREAECAARPTVAAAPWCALHTGTSAETVVYWGGLDPNEACVTSSGRVVRRDRLARPHEEPQHVVAAKLGDLFEQMAVWEDVPPPPETADSAGVPF